MSTHPIELRILGHTELTTAGTLTGGVVLRQPKRLALLAYLALATSNGFRRRDQIVALFWPDKDQLHARTQLRKALYALRGVLGQDALVSRGEEEVRLNLAKVWCDAVVFRQFCERREWSQAIALYRGELLDGLFPGGVGQEFEAWLDEQRASLRDAAAQAAWECSSLADVAGDRDAAIAFVRRANDLNPDDEQSVRRLIAALDRYGDRAGALRTFGDWQQRLLSEFGAEPAPETRKLARQVQAVRKGESVDTPAFVRPIELPTSEAPVPQQVAGKRQHVRRRPLIAATVSTVAVLVLTVFVAAGRYAGSPTADLAVLPFRAGGDSIGMQLGESIAEEIATAIAHGAGVRVQSSVRTREVVRQEQDFMAVARALRVAHVLEGSLLRDANRIHVRARLVDARDGRALWARVLDVDAANLIAAHEQIAAVAGSEITRVLRRQTP